jgi:hypothetical protein
MKRLLIMAAMAAIFFAGCGDDSAGKTTRSSGSVADGAAAAATPATQGSQSANSQADTRKIIVNSTMRLEVRQLRSAYLEAGQLVRSFGGFVAESSIDDTGGDADTASMRLRVPASRHDDLVTALRALGGGRVLKEGTTSREVTAEYTDLQSRLRNFQRSEAQYQELMKQARTVDEILNVQSRLDSLRGQIEEAQGRLNLLDNQVDFATVTLTLGVPGATASEGIPGPRKMFGEAWDAALVVARLILNLGVVLVVAAIWLAIPALLVFLGIRFSARWRVKPTPPP